MTVTQPAAKMLVELSRSQVRKSPCKSLDLQRSTFSIVPCAQDIVAGDGTTSVVVICGSLLKKAQELLDKGVHPTVISDSFNKAAQKACQVIWEGGRVLVGLCWQTMRMHVIVHAFHSPFLITHMTRYWNLWPSLSTWMTGSNYSRQQQRESGRESAQPHPLIRNGPFAVPSAAKSSLSTPPCSRPWLWMQSSRSSTQRGRICECGLFSTINWDRQEG